MNYFLQLRNFYRHPAIMSAFQADRFTMQHALLLVDNMIAI